MRNHYSHEYLREQGVGRALRFFIKPMISYLRLWDRAAGQRVDHFIANSRATAERIATALEAIAGHLSAASPAAGNRESAWDGKAHRQATSKRYI